MMTKRAPCTYGYSFWMISHKLGHAIQCILYCLLCLLIQNYSISFHSITLVSYFSLLQTNRIKCRFLFFTGKTVIKWKVQCLIGWWDDTTQCSHSCQLCFTWSRLNWNMVPSILSRCRHILSQSMKNSVNTFMWIWDGGCKYRSAMSSSCTFTLMLQLKIDCKKLSVFPCF